MSWAAPLLDAALPYRETQGWWQWAKAAGPIRASHMRSCPAVEKSTAYNSWGCLGVACVYTSQPIPILRRQSISIKQSNRQEY